MTGRDLFVGGRPVEIAVLSRPTPVVELLLSNMQFRFGESELIDVTVGENNLEGIMRGSESKTVKVSKAQLLEKLHENKEKHTREYVEAFHGWRAALLDVVQRELNKAQAGGNRLSGLEARSPDVQSEALPDVNRIARIYQDRPVNHSQDYATAIEVMTWSVEEDVEITLGDFERYVQDCWDWSAKHGQTCSSYDRKE